MVRRSFCRVAFLALACCLSLLWASQASADTLFFSCSGLVCGPEVNGITTIGSSSPSLTLGTHAGSDNALGLGGGAGTAFVGVAIPNNTSLTGITINTNSPTAGPVSFLGPLDPNNSVFNALSEIGGTDANFSSYASKSSPVIGATVTNFRAFDWNICAFSTHTDTCAVAFGGTALPLGTIIFAFLEKNSTDSIADQSPLSGDLIVTTEPGTLSLFGFGLVGLGTLGRRWLKAVRN